MSARVSRWSWDARAVRVAASLFVAPLLAGCAPAGSYIWVQSLPIVPAQAPQQHQPFVIAAGDLLDVRVYNEERLSSKGRVRYDGKLALPLLGDVPAAGKAPAQLAQELQERLKSFLQAPTVTVVVEEIHPSSFSMVGEVTRPGVYPLTPHTGLLEALALGGGLTQFADADAIFIVRRSPPQRFRVTYEQLTTNDPHAVAFRLADGDVIVVE